MNWLPVEFQLAHSQTKAMMGLKKGRCCHILFANSKQNVSIFSGLLTLTAYPKRNYYYSISAVESKQPNYNNG